MSTAGQAGSARHPALVLLTPKSRECPTAGAGAPSAGRRNGNVVKPGGGATRHTRAWSANVPAIVADCRRLRSRRSGIEGAGRQPSAAKLGRPRPLGSGQRRPTTTTRRTCPPPLSSENTGRQDPRQDRGQEDTCEEAKNFDHSRDRRPRPLRSVTAIQRCNRFMPLTHPFATGCVPSTAHAPSRQY